jgi:hypothetical protein
MASGCALFFSEGERLIGAVPREPGSGVVLRTALSRDTHAIRFRSAAPMPNFSGGDIVTVTLTNTSKSSLISIHIPGAFAEVSPRSGALLYNGTLAGLLSRGSFSVSSIGGRASCELHIRFSSPPTLAEPIQVLCWHSSTPL